MVECEDSSAKIEVNEQANAEYDYNATKLRKTLTNTEILAQAIVFLLAGSETTSTSICWIAHNLAMNPECQDKLIEEVDSVLEKHVILF
jgi:cytochrome P450